MGQVYYLDDGLLVGKESELIRVLDFLTVRFAAMASTAFGNQGTTAHRAV